MISHQLEKRYIRPTKERQLHEVDKDDGLCLFVVAFEKQIRDRDIFIRKEFLT